MAETVIRIRDGRFREDGLGCGIHLRRDKCYSAGGKQISRTIDDLNRKIHLQLGRLLNGHIDVRLEAARTINRGKDSGGSDTITDADRNVTDDTARGAITL
jgi:hypothetical protein